MFVIGRFVAVVWQTKVVKGDWQDLCGVIDDRDPALAKLFDVVLIKKQAPGAGNVGGAKNGFDLVDVVTNTRGPPHVRKTVKIARVIDLELFHQHRVQVFPVGQLAATQFLNGSGLYQP